MNIFLLLSTLLVLLGTQCYVAHSITRRGLNILVQIAAVAAIATASATLWYVLEAKYDWSLPSRSQGLGIPHPKHDAGVMFAMGWVWYLLILVSRNDQRK